MAGTSMSARICPPASCEAASPLPARVQEQLPPPCCELCNSGVYHEGTQPVDTQARTYNLSRVRKEAWRVCSCCTTVSIMGIYNRQFRVTRSWTDSPHRRMTMKPEVKPCWRKATQAFTGVCEV